MGQSIKFKEVIFWKDDDNILYCQSINDSIQSLNLDKAKIYVKAINELCGENPMPFIIDLRNTKWTFSILAAKELSKNPKLLRLRISEAYVANSMGMELLIKSYKRLFDPGVPFKIFKSLEEAIHYCEQVNCELHGSI